MDNVKTPQDLLDWAHANYENGGDTLVECYSLGDMEVEFFTPDGEFRKDLVASLVDVWQERQADADFYRDTW